MRFTLAEIEALREAVLPLMQWLNDNCHPHCTVMVNSERIELVEGLATAGRMPVSVPEGGAAMSDATLRDQIYRMEFLMTDGCTRCPKDILDLAINRYGEETVHKEMMKAYKWLLSHAARHKKRRVSGIGLFLLNWLESAAFFRLRDAEQKKNSYNRWED